MTVDNWLSGETHISVQIVDEALDELREEQENIKGMVDKEDYWGAYKRLCACISFFSMATQQQPIRLPWIIQALLNWIQRMKGHLDKMVKGIGGNGYSIGVSAPFGVSVSISFLA